MAIAAAVKDDAARLRVLDAIKQITGAFTVADIVARTGLAPFQAEGQLSDIVKAYESDLDVDDEGNLIYTFAPGPKGREDIVKKDAARRRKQAMKQWFVTFFKWWTVAMVIVYFLIYVVLLIAAIAAASKGRDSNSSSGRRTRGSFGGGSSFMWFGMSPWGYGGYGTHTTRRRRRRQNRELQGRLERGEDPYDMRADGAKKKPSLAERTWYFLFGTKGIKRNPLEREKELLTYIRAKKGFVSNADIIALLGVTYEEADSIGTRLVATYEGEMDITDDGIAIYRFPNMTLAADPEVAKQAASLGYLWQVRDKEQALRDNPSRVIPILNGVNLVLAFVMWFKVLPYLGMASLGGLIGLVWFPMLFSIMFFAVAFARKSREAAQARDYKTTSIRISMFKLLFTRRTAIRVPGDEREIAQAGLGTWQADELKAVMPQIAEDLRGTAELSGGTLVLRADRVWKEMAAVDQLRARASSTKSVGRTVFSSDDAKAVEGQLPSGDDLEAEIAALEAELN
jgi:hypothetical protein